MPKIKQLIGAIKGTTYGPDTKMKITTLQNVFYMGRGNDLSFELDGKLIVLIEHQSTLSENIPLRMLFYITELYNLHMKGKDIYRRKKFPLPLPEFIVLFNGREKMPENSRVLKLSDMFIGHNPALPANLELTVTMYNINKGRNKKMFKRCAALYEYSIFIDMAREYEKTMSR